MNNEYLFIDTGVKKMKWFLSSHEVPFPATSDRRLRVAGTRALLLEVNPCRPSTALLTPPSWVKGGLFFLTILPFAHHCFAQKGVFFRVGDVNKEGRLLKIHPL